MHFTAAISVTAYLNTSISLSNENVCLAVTRLSTTVASQCHKIGVSFPKINFVPKIPMCHEYKQIGPLSLSSSWWLFLTFMVILTFCASICFFTGTDLGGKNLNLKKIAKTQVRCEADNCF
jgi:hypothetical protein